MKNLILITLSVLSISCAAAPDFNRDKFYEENKDNLNAVLGEVDKSTSDTSVGKELLFPLFMKTKMSFDINLLADTSSGLLIKTNSAKVTFVSENASEIFFVGEGRSLLEVYSDIFTMNMDEINRKYSNDKTVLYGIYDFKIALSIPAYKERGYYDTNAFIIYFLIKEDSSEAFVLNKKFPDEAIRIAAQSLDSEKFRYLITNITTVN